MEERQVIVHEQTWDVLEEVIKNIEYLRDARSDWRRFEFKRKDSDNYAVLYIFTHNPDTYNLDRIRHTRHEFVVPVATYNEASWARWVFDCIASIEFHETCESFLYKGKRVYAPHHGNGWNPYVAWYDGHPDEQAKGPGED